MDEQSSERPSETDEWPSPSRDVLRELDRPVLAWPEPDADGDARAA